MRLQDAPPGMRRFYPLDAIVRESFDIARERREQKMKELGIVEFRHDLFPERVGIKVLSLDEVRAMYPTTERKSTRFSMCRVGDDSTRSRYWSVGDTRNGRLIPIRGFDLDKSDALTIEHVLNAIDAGSSVSAWHDDLLVECRRYYEFAQAHKSDTSAPNAGWWPVECGREAVNGR